VSYTKASTLTKAGNHYAGDQLWSAFAPMTPADQRNRAQQALREIARIAVATDTDEVVAAAVAWIETGEAGTGLPFRSSWWRERNNLGNIGVTGDPTQNDLSQSWDTPADGAMGLMAHLVAYAYGNGWRKAWDTDALGLPWLYDRRFDLVLHELGGRAFRTIGDLNRRWAVDSDDDYGGKLAKRANALVAAMTPVTTPSTGPEPVEQEPSMATPVFGRVPHPLYQNRIVTSSRAWDDLGPRTIRAAVWHRMHGTLWGTDSYFRGAAVTKALTDYGVGVAATDGAQQAGALLRWNDPNGRRAPWASGPVNNPTGDAVPFLDRYGVNGINRDAVSIEISGNGDTALDAKARATVVALTAYYADQYGVPWDAFPAVPGEDRSFVMWHGEIYDGKRNSCPGAVVMAATDGMIDEIKVILKRYQAASAPVDPADPVYAKPQPPAKGDSIVNGRIFLAHAHTYTTKAAVVPRIYADPGSDPTGPRIPKGTQVTTSHVVSDVGESADLTAVLVDGSRIPIRDVLV